MTAWTCPNCDRLFDRVNRGHADIVSVGIFLKNPAKFAELLPRQRWVAADRLDDELIALLAEAYDLVAR